jgi:hypothetical protein
MTGWIGASLLVVVLALVVCSWWLGTLCASAGHVRLKEPREPAVRSLGPGRPRAMSAQRVVILDECDDGVFRAI